MRNLARVLPVLTVLMLLLVSFSVPVMAGSINQPVLPDAHLPLRFVVSDQGHGGRGGGSGSSCTASLPGATGVAYTPSQIQAAYQYGSSNGAGKTIAIIDAYGDPNLASDLACFDKVFSLQAASLSILQPFGKPRGGNSNWGLETALDVEWAHAMAPGASILLIITPSASLSYLINDAVPYAVSAGANIISMSWGAYEDQLSCSTWSQESSYFASAVNAGVIPVAASGDNGAYYNNQLTVLYPASDPNVVGTGGTSLTTIPTGYGSEAVWDTSSTEATGGGVSSCFSEPAYQSSHGIVVTTAGGVSATPSGRAVPDVAYNSDPYTGYWVYDTSGFSGWVQVGGTSAAAPQWSAIFADAQAAGDSVSGGSVHAQLYLLMGTSSLHDVTNGDNNYYYASTGYDATTGVGSPVEANILAAW